jgi:mRNA-degrading endonuclease RelE of RelBE toxin-antitoxin system
VPKTSEIILLKEAQKDLNKLNASVRKRVLKALDKLAENPRLAKRLSGDLKQVHSYRFGTPSGEFRIAFLRESEKLIILAIGSRKEIYRDLRRKH